MALSFVKREIVLDPPDSLESPFYAELHVYDAGFDIPKFHVTRSKAWPVGEIKEDDVIWLVGQLSSPWGKLPPAIDGKIIVGEIEEIQKKERKSIVKFLAKEGSVWFPLVDAREALSKLEVVLKNGDIRRLYDSEKDNLGQAFQSLKRIYDPGAFNDWASEVLASECEFISYRIADGTKGAFAKVAQQIKLGSCVFWDRWSLPRRLAERREIVSDEALDKLLMQKIRESSKFWGIESPKYSEEGSYSKKEKELALELKKYNGFSVVRDNNV